MLKRRLLLGISGGGGRKLSSPQFNMAPGYYSGTSKSVRITNPNPSGVSTIKYTLDGTEPTATNGTTYGGGSITISAPGKTLYAVCVPNSSAYSISDVSGGQYLISSKYMLAPKISPSSGTYTSSINVEMVDLNDPGVYASIYYSIGKYSDPINNGTVYTAPITLSTSGDYHIKAICKDSTPTVSNTVTTVDYTLDIEEPTPTIPQPFKESSLIVRMYLNNDEPSQILSSSFDYTNWTNKGIKVLISDGSNGEIVEYNNYTQIDSSGWTGTYTVPTNGYYFVIVCLPSSEIPSLLFKGTNITDIEYIAPEITRIGSSGIDPTNECSINYSQLDSYGAFRESSLRTIILDRVSHTTYTSLKSGVNLQVIGAGSFKHCTSVIEVEFPDSVEYICGCAFYSMNLYEDTLREIYLPERVKYIGYGAFSGCYYVQDYHMENCKSLVRIYSEAFSANQSMATITIPASVTTIDSHAFSDSTSQYANIYDCCRLVEVINKSSINLSPSTNHSSGIGKYCLRYVNSGSSLLNPRILIDGAKFLSFKPNSSSSIVHYLVHIIPTYNQYGYIVFPDGDRTIETYIINTAALAKTPANQYIPINGCVGISINNDAVTEIKDYAFIGGWTEIGEILLLGSDASAAPTVSSNTFRDLRDNGILYYWWQMTNIDSWISTNPYYLGYKNWDAGTLGP